MEHWWNETAGQSKVFEDKFVLVLFCPLQIPRASNPERHGD
jgi:hypothetical protein